MYCYIGWTGGGVCLGLTLDWHGCVLSDYHDLALCMWVAYRTVDGVIRRLGRYDPDRSWVQVGNIRKSSAPNGLSRLAYRRVGQSQVFGQVDPRDQAGENPAISRYALIHRFG